MVRTETSDWLPCAHALVSAEDGDIIAEGLLTIQQWIKDQGKEWKLRYALTNDSAAEQRAIKLAFQGLLASQLEVTHLLCRVHSMRTLDRKLARGIDKEAKRHLVAALCNRKTSIGCDESINAAINAAPQDQKEYINKEWKATKAQWANYARMHSTLLLQVLTTNPVEAWHRALKVALKLGKNNVRP